MYVPSSDAAFTKHLMGDNDCVNNIEAMKRVGDGPVHRVAGVGARC